MASGSGRTQAGEFIAEEQGISSIIRMEVEPGARAYRYDVKTCIMVPGRNGGPAVEKQLPKGADDGERFHLREINYELLVIALEGGSFGIGNISGAFDIVYDQRSTLYCSQQLYPERVQLQLPEDSFVRSYYGGQRGLHCYFSMEMAPSQRGHVLALDDLSQYTSGTEGPLLEEDRSLRTFHEMATSMFAVNNRSYTPIGMGRLYCCEEASSPVVNLGKGMVLYSGLAKGAKVIQSVSKEVRRGRNNSTQIGGATMSLVFDFKGSPFFKPQCLLNTVLEMMPGSFYPCGSEPWTQAARLLKNVHLRTTYGERVRTFPFERFTNVPISQLRAGDQLGMSIPDYFHHKYHIVLNQLKLPGIVVTTRMGGSLVENIYPLELIEVMPAQRVPLEKMSGQISKQLLQHNAVTAQERLARIMHHLAGIGSFSEENEVLKAFGIRLIPHSNRANVYVRAAPCLEFGGGGCTLPESDKANWTRGSSRMPYLEASSISNWLVLYLNREESIISHFMRYAMEMMESKGMRTNTATYIPMGDETLREPRKLLEMLQGVVTKYPSADLMLLITPKRGDSGESHAYLKYIEAVYSNGVVTQHLSSESVRNVVEGKQVQTLSNMIHKLNIKNYGFNYRAVTSGSGSPLELSSRDVLVVGYDVAHPPPARGRERGELKKRGLTVDSVDPSVVGITANMARNPHHISGDYFYQESCREAVNPAQLAARITWILRQRETNIVGSNKGGLDYKPPSKVVVLRDGVSESQYRMVVQRELKAIEVGCRNYRAGYRPHFLLVIATKRHLNRFFVEKAATAGHGPQFNGTALSSVTNLRPCSVMQGPGVSRYSHTEFFMQSHYPLKGVGKAVGYTVLHDEIHPSQDHLQRFLNELCYSHQIIMSAVSLPEPIYQADELAKRGSNNFRIFRQLHEVPRLSNGLADHEKLNEHLSYMARDANRRRSIASTRFTA